MSKEAKAYHHKWISDEKDLRDRYQVMQDYADQEVKKALKEHQKKALINLMELDQKTNKEQTKG